MIVLDIWHWFEETFQFSVAEAEYTGQKRVVQKLQTNGMYTGIYVDPDCEISRFNNGKGSWIGFGKASDWTFCNGVCQQKYR